MYDISNICSIRSQHKQSHSKKKVLHQSCFMVSLEYKQKINKLKNLPYTMVQLPGQFFAILYKATIVSAHTLLNSQFTTTIFLILSLKIIISFLPRLGNLICT